jgi:hypothetical protein
VAHARLRIVLDALSIANNHEGRSAKLVMRALSHHPAADGRGPEFPDVACAEKAALRQGADHVPPQLKDAKASFQVYIEPVMRAPAMCQTEPLKVPQSTAGQRRPGVGASHTIRH